MLPRPSRLKSLASELSPVLTTPPPVEPKTVFVLMSVPEMMLSSNLVVLRRRIATIAAMPARIASAPPPIAQVGVLAIRSSKKPGADFGGSATFGAALVAAFGGSAGVTAAFGGSLGVVSVFAGSTLGGSAFDGSGVVTAAFGGSTFAGSTLGGSTFAGSTLGGAVVIGVAADFGSGPFAVVAGGGAPLPDA